jgi:hypothetical protein
MKLATAAASYVSVRLATIVVLIANTSACSSDPVSDPTWRMARAELTRAAAVGYPARVVLEGAAATPAPGKTETLVVIGSRTVKVLPAPQIEEFTSGGFQEYLLRVWVARYLVVSDLDGAVRAAARGYTHALEDQKVLAKGPPLPPVPDPNEWGFLYPSKNADWGLLVSFMVLVLCVLLDRLARKRPASPETGA